MSSVSDAMCSHFETGWGNNVLWGSRRSRNAWCRWRWCWSCSRSLRSACSLSNTPTGRSTVPWTLFERFMGMSVRGARSGNEASSQRATPRLYGCRTWEYARGRPPSMNRRVSHIRMKQVTVRLIVWRDWKMRGLGIAPGRGAMGPTGRSRTRSSGRRGTRTGR